MTAAERKRAHKLLRQAANGIDRATRAIWRGSLPRARRALVSIFDAAEKLRGMVDPGSKVQLVIERAPEPRLLRDGPDAPGDHEEEDLY